MKGRLVDVVDVHAEAAKLMADGTSDRVEDIKALTVSFIRTRLSNSSNMEATKAKALRILSERLDKSEEDGGEPLSINRLMEIITLISEHTGNDMNTLIEAFSGGGKKGAGDVNVFLGGSVAESAPLDNGQRVIGAKSTFKLFDALDSVAMQVVSARKKSDGQ